MADETEKIDNADDLNETPAEAPKKGKPNFSDEEKEFINELVNNVFGRGFKKASTEFESSISPVLNELKNELGSIKAELAEVKTPKSKKKEEAPKDSETDNELVVKLRAQEELINTFQNRFKDMEDSVTRAKELERSQRLKDKVISEAKSIGFFDPDDVYVLLNGEFKMDDKGNPVVWSTESDAPRLDFDAKPMSLKARLEELAKKKPHLVKSDNVVAGSGSRETAQLDTRRQREEDKLPDFSKMSDEDFDKYTGTVENKRFVQ